jgi:hypothetical protein
MIIIMVGFAHVIVFFFLVYGFQVILGANRPPDNLASIPASPHPRIPTSYVTLLYPLTPTSAEAKYP